MNVAASESFDRIRPFCIELMQNSNPQTITALHKTLLSIREDTIDEMAQYVLFPIRVTLKKSNCNEEMKIKISQCFAHVFKHCTVNDWKVVHEMLTSLCLMITDPVDKTLGATGSEELKIGVIQALTSLVGHTCYPVWQKLYDAENIPLLGHVVTLLLSVIKSNVGGELRVAACEALSSLCKPEYANLVEECNQIGFRLTVGNCVACFLPGITSNLSKILVKDSSVNHKIKSACLDLLSTVITVTLSDEDISACGKRELRKPPNQKLAVLIVKRDKKWTSIVTEKLGPIIANAIAASDSDNWSERVCCLNFCSSLLLCCRDTLKSYSNLLLKVPIKLLSDDYQQVIDRSNEILKTFSSILAKNKADVIGLVAILEENLFSLCSDLPRLMRKASDEEKLSSLKILLGYLTLLKEKLDSLLNSFVHLKKLAAALLHCFELDTSSIQFLEQVSPSPGDNSETGCLVQHFRKQFCHFRDVRIRTVLCSICRQLGQFGDVELLVDHFVEIYASSETNCKQAVMILNELLLGAKNSSRIEPVVLKSLVSSVLDEYIAPENWYLVTTFSSEYFYSHYMSRKHKMEMNDQQNSKSLVPRSSVKPSQKELTSKLLKSNTVLACLHLESLLVSSVVLGEKFRILLMSSLSLLLEKTTDEDISISACATRVLRGVARNCGYKSAEQLIAANADYIISDISIQLNHIDLFPRCPSVLTAMLNNSNSDILVIVSDTVDEIVTSFDLHHLNPRKILIFLPVLLSVVRAVKRWTTVSEGKTEVNSLTTNSEKKKNSFKETGSTSTVSQIEKIPVGKHAAFVNKLRQDLLDSQINQRTANMEFEDTPECQENEFENPNSNQDNEEHVDVEEEKEKIPLEIQVVSKVLERCIHLMTHSDPRVRMRVMEVVCDGMQVMSMKENQLLPMAHKFWQPLVARFQDRELQVVSKAFDTLCIIASHSKDFLRKRFSKEILPKLLTVLRHQASFSTSTRTKSSYSSKSSHIHLPGGFESTLDSDSSAYSYTVTYKLQKSVLLSLGQLLKSIDVNKKELDSVCTSLLPYLSSRQDVQLQDAAYALFEHMISIDRDIVWLSLTSVWCPMSTLAPLQPLNYQIGARLRTIHLAGNTSTDSEYYTNISKLLKIC